MKRTILKSILSIACLLALNTSLKAQTTVTVDPAATWLGYMIVFNTPANGGGYVFDTPWGVSDLKSTISASGVTLQPNFNAYNAADPFWSNGAIGNKVMEALTYVETNTISNQNVTFQGQILSNTLDPAYTREAFVKALDPNNGYATVASQTVPLPATGSYSVTAAIPNTPGLIVQWGFRVVGLNANPTQEAALGSVSAGPIFPLATKLVNFTATSKGSNTMLSWTAENEENLVGYEVEKSLNGTSFEKVGFVKANNISKSEYGFMDNMSNGTAYYRLKMKDVNGSVSYSNTVIVKVAISNGTSLFPNPASQTLYVNTSKQKATVYSMTGAMLIRAQMNEGLNTIDVQGLKDGFYFIQMEDGTKLNFIKK